LSAASQPSPQSQAVVKTVADVTRGVAAELCDLCDMVDQLQPMLSDLVGASSQPLDLAHYEKLQTLDYISQHLKGLEQFLILVAAETATKTQVDCTRALSSITLSDLHGRLLEVTAADFPAEVDDDDPDWELF
jgi:hypothetical protein